MSLLLGVDVPPDQPRHDLGQRARSASTRPSLIYVLRDDRDDARVLLRDAPQGRAGAVGHPQNIAESGVDFVRNQIIMQTMGADGLGYLPFLAALFFFIFFSNISEIIPVVQFPANARIGDAAVARAAHVGDLQRRRHQEAGPVAATSRTRSSRRACRRRSCSLVVPIEFVSTFLVRPFSLAVRLFANMLAGHLILVTFAVTARAALCAASVTIVILPFSFALLVALTGFEILVGFLQAFIFTILTAVYIGGSMHPEH